MPLRLHHSDDDFAARFCALVDAERAADADVGGAVAEIVANVRDQGDAALLAYTERFDGHALSAADLRVDRGDRRRPPPRRPRGGLRPGKCGGPD